MTFYPVRLGIVGCGTVVEAFHLPASLVTPEVEVVALVDRDASRARWLADRFGVKTCFDRHDALIGRVDAVLVATPPQTHASIAYDLLSQGIHVLCEKPLAPTGADCRRMIEAARAGNAILATAQSRRFHFNLAQIKRLVDAEAFGTSYHVRALDGYTFSWPTQTGYMFHGQTACGVLLESGIHVLDALLWLFGAPEVVWYADDALGGVESNVEIALQWSPDRTAEVKISRTADLANTLEIHGSLGWARLDLYDGRTLTVHLPQSKAGRVLGTATLQASVPQDGPAVMAQQLSDFARSLVEGQTPRATGCDGLRSIELVERCYQTKTGRPVPQQIPLPGVVWHDSGR